MILFLSVVDKSSVLPGTEWFNSMFNSRNVVPWRFLFCKYVTDVVVCLCHKTRHSDIARQEAVYGRWNAATSLD